MGARTAYGAYAALILAAWIGLHGIYRPENIDDAWYLSMAYSHLHGGDPGDPVFGGNTGGVQLFGMLFAHLWGWGLDSFGWTKSTAHLISTAVMLVGAGFWWGTSRRLLPEKGAAGAFVALLLVAEPFFAAANQARPDTLTFTLIAATMFCVVTERYVVAGLLAMLAFESHPMGLLAAWLGGAVVVGCAGTSGTTSIRWRGIAGRVGLGAAIGAGVYLALHAKHLGVFRSAIDQNLTAGNFLWEYFLETKFKRHLPELGILLSAAALAIIRRDLRPTLEVRVLAVAAILGSMVLPRGNFHYAVLVYPCLLLFLVDVAFRARALVPLLALFWCLLVPQYGFVWWRNRAHDFDAYLAAVTEAVPEDDVPIVGPPNAWFAFRDRTFYAHHYGKDFVALGLRDLWWLRDRTEEVPVSQGIQTALDERYELVGAKLGVEGHPGLSVARLQQRRSR